jgi:hypothetical protein
MAKRAALEIKKNVVLQRVFQNLAWSKQEFPFSDFIRKLFL